MNNTIILEEDREVLLGSLKEARIGFWELDICSGTFKSSSVLDEILGIDNDYDRTIEGWVKLIHQDDREVIYDYYRNYVIAQKNHFNKQYRIEKNDDKTTRWIHSIGKLKFDSDKNVTKVFGTCQDITERKNSETLKNLSTKILAILNSAKSKKVIIRHILTLIKDEMKFSAVGMRYKDGNDYPYFEQNGFSDSFIRAENSLIAKEKNGTLCVDKDGNIILDCTCGLVISGINPQSAPFLTERGSFITNNSFPLLELTPDQDPRFHPRNTCIHRKYGSMAIIPIKYENRIVGTLQINEHKTNAFSNDMVLFLEDICLSIGSALMRLDVKDLLENKEKFLLEVQETGRIGTYEFNIATNKWGCSQILADIFGIDANYEMTFENWLNIVHPDQRGMMHDYFVDEVLGKRNRFDKVYKIVRLYDQTDHWVHGFGKIKLNDKNEIISLIGTISDITEQKKSEIELERSESFNKGILKSLMSHLAVIDHEGKIISVNDSWNRFGIENGETTLANIGIGSNYFEVCERAILSGDKIASEALQAMKNVLTGIDPYFYMEYPCDSPDIKRWFSMRVLKFNNFEKPMVITLHQDITERKNIENEREKAFLDLVQRNKDLEQFSYIVSHNLRAPVVNILGINRILHDEALDNEMQKLFLQMLNTSTEKLDSVIRDLNHVLQIRNNLNEQRVNIRFPDLLSDINLSIANLINDTGTKIISDFSDVIEVHSLKSYLYSIFYNLISNSIKYKQEHINPVIEISSRKMGDTVQLIFKDNGRGIDLSKRGGQVFGLYKRFHDHVEGKGVGLFMVKNQVESIGGKISIESEVNIGTTFRIVFEHNNENE